MYTSVKILKYFGNSYIIQTSLLEGQFQLIGFPFTTGGTKNERWDEKCPLKKRILHIYYRH